MSRPTVSVAADVTGSSLTVLEFRAESATERAAKRKALLQEAKAWRQIAEEIATRGAPQHATFGYLFRGSAMPSMRMGDRHGAHIASRYVSLEYPGERVIAALFMALECEDEAEALREACQSAPRKKVGR